MNEYNFEAVWVHKAQEITVEVEITIECLDEQMAREKAFEKAMRIHKNMCAKDKEFSNTWQYGGVHLMYTA